MQNVASAGFVRYSSMVQLPLEVTWCKVPIMMSYIAQKHAHYIRGYNYGNAGKLILDVHAYPPDMHEPMA